MSVRVSLSSPSFFASVFFFFRFFLKMLPGISYGTFSGHKGDVNEQSRSINKNEVLLFAGKVLGGDSAGCYHVSEIVNCFLVSFALLCTINIHVTGPIECR